MLFYRCHGGEKLEVIRSMPRDHFVKLQHEVASAASTAPAEEEDDNGTCALPGAVVRFCFHVTVMLETGATTIDLVKFSEANESFTVYAARAA